MASNTYIAPEIKVVVLHAIKLMAGSYIEQGNTDGQGTGQYDAPAKQGSSLFDLENETENTSGW